MKIQIEAPTDDVRRERVEKATFARLDAIRAALEVPASDRDRIEEGVFRQLAVMRGRDHVDFALRPRRRWLPIAGVAMAAAAAVVLVIALRGGSDVREPVVAQHVVPPGSDPVRWTSGDAIVEAFADTEVAERIDDSGVTLLLARGKVDCSVEPIPGRAPFRVVAGDVTVTVIGTRFAVARTPGGVRVDVAHGKVRVVSGSSEKLLAAGESWTSTTIATLPLESTAGTAPVVSGAAAPASDPPPTDPAADVDVAAIDLAPDAPAKPAIKEPSAKELYETGAALEARNKGQAAQMYRRAASSKDPRYAALALQSLADLERNRTPANALRAIDEYLRRFPNGVAVEDLLYTRAEIYRATNQIAQMKTAAREYLRRFPAGTYAAKARMFARD